MYYYELHVFFNRFDGYSFAFKSETSLNSEDEIINRATELDLFTEDGDQMMVDYAEETTEDAYELLKLN